MDLEHVHIHGQRYSYRMAGAGPPVLLVHGITGDSRSWLPLTDELAAHARLMVPDLPGYGRSDPHPSGDYSVAAYACSLRDLMVATGLERATIVGHSLGGGIAMQFAYQFPDMVDRLVLVSSGGFGRELSPLLRAAVLPGAGPVIKLLASPRGRALGRRVSRLLRRGGANPATLDDAVEGLRELTTPTARKTFVRTSRAVFGLGGQHMSAYGQGYLMAHMPTLIVWGDEDPMIPVSHAWQAHAAITGSRLEIVTGSGHFPHVDDPALVADVVTAFMAATEPAELAPQRWQALLQAGP